MNKGRRALGALACMLSLTVHADPVRVLTEDDPPFNLREAGGQIGGVATDMVRDIFQRARLPYTLELLPWARAYNLALTEADVCLYATTRNAEREKRFLWIGPLLVNAWAIYAGPHSPDRVRTLDDVRPPAVIGGYLGDAVAQYLVDRGYRVQQINDDARNVQLLALGRIDYWASGVYHANYLLAKSPQTAIHPVLQFNVTDLYLACNPQLPGTAFARLRQAFSAMQRDGTLDRIRHHD